MWRLAALLFFLLCACSHHKTRLDCIDICKAHGLRFVEVVEGTAGYDSVEREEKKVDACRCR